MATESKTEIPWPPVRKHLPMNGSLKRLARHAMVPLESVMAVNRIMTREEIVNWLKGVWREKRKTRRFEQIAHKN